MATSPPLGMASSFAILGGSTVTNTGATDIVGNVGVSPGTSITGFFPPGVVTGGGLHANDTLAMQAEADLATAYAILRAEPVDASLSGQNLGGQTLAPGVYNFTGAAQLNGTLTLDAEGDPNAVFVIQVGTALTTATDSSVVLTGGAHARDVFWQVGSSATIGSGTAFAGNILAFTSITLDSGANIAPGRALAINGAVTMDTNTASDVFTTPLTITADDQTNVYGAALPVLTASYKGFVNGDTPASLTTQPTLTTTATANSHVAGNPYPISVGGAVDPDYTISYVSGSLTVTTAPLTITADDQSKAYGAAVPTLTATYTGLVNGDMPADLSTPPTLTTTATSASDVAGNPYPITARGAVDGDYSINYSPGSLTVDAAPLTITADDRSKAYGAALPALTASYSGFVNGDTASSLTTPPALSTTGTAASHVGSYAITAAGAVDGDYSINYAPGSLAVDPVMLTITANDQTKVYGAPVPTLTASYSGFVNGDTAANLSTPPTLTTTATANSHVAGNPYPITIGGAADDDYSISYNPGTLTVTTAPLTITADDQSKAYGAAVPTLTASYSGFVSGDGSASLTTPPTLATTATASSHVVGNPYAITAAGAADGDYSISYAPGSLTVTPVMLTITANDQTKVYGAAVPTLTASYTGLVNGDTSATFGAASNTPPSTTTTATADSSVAGSPYVISVGGAVDPNYSIGYAAGALTVTPTGRISGTVYLDLDVNGVLNAGEPGLAGRVVFLDLNHDGTLDAGDPSAITDANGNFTLANNSSTGTGPVLEATAQDANNRYVVDQTATDASGTVTIGVVPISPVAPAKVVPDPFSSSPNANPDAAYVQALYHAVLGRVGGDSEVATWLAEMNGGMTRQDVAEGFVNSLEHRQDQVQTYYEEFLHRAPDPTSVYWVNELLSGVSEETVVESFLDSPEYQAAHQDSTLFIGDLYVDVLGRRGGSTEVAAWQADLASGTSREAIEASFVESPEAEGQIVTSFYAAFLHRPRELGTTSEFWVSMLESPGGSATGVAVGILASPEFDQEATTSGG